jgi:dockerin type I repeat protein
MRSRPVSLRRKNLRSGVLLPLLVVAFLLVSARAALALSSALQFPATGAFAGQAGEIPLQSVTDFSYQGFSVSVAYDPAVIQITEITSAGTIVEAIPADFFRANIFVDQKAFVIGCLVDATPPFDDRMIPGPGIPLSIARVLFQVPPDLAPQTTLLHFEDGFGQPPIQNILSVQSQSVPPDQLQDGIISILRKPIFVRGDTNQDTTVDVADPVYLINFLFLNRPPPPCMAAADCNDDGAVDLADAIFILQYYFQKGLRPPEPFPNPGVDTTPNRKPLSCLEPAF